MERIETVRDIEKDFEGDPRSSVDHRDESDDDRLSYHVLEMVSTAAQRPVEELRPLYEVIDPDALEALFEWKGDKANLSANGVVRFRYEGCDVRIRTDGKTIVSRRKEGRS